ncbi:MAG TPA: hypothetical protein VGN09_18645 [Vicinamibacteria bacterium]|jgi:hypothetical protein
MAHIHFKRDVPVDPSLRTAVERSFALLPDGYSVSISLREGTDDWSVQVVGPASVVAGRIAINDQKPEAITRFVRQMIRGLEGG